MAEVTVAPTVFLTAEEEKALNKVCNDFYMRNSEIVEIHSKYPDGWVDEISAINGMELDRLIRALYVGYEVEKTKEEKIKDLYNRQMKLRPSDQMPSTFAIIQTLNILGIEIEGVNSNQHSVTINVKEVKGGQIK